MILAFYFKSLLKHETYKRPIVFPLRYMQSKKNFLKKAQKQYYSYIL